MQRWLGALAGALVGGTACSGPDFDAGPANGMPEFHTGLPAATVFAGTSGSFSVVLAVAAEGPGSIRRVYVAARDAALNESPCVQGPAYETP